MRDADELHEALCGLGVLDCDAPPLAGLAAELVAARRATALTIEGRRFWAAAERLELVRRAYPRGGNDPPEVIAPPAARAIPEGREACAAEILRGWFECSGPLRASETRGPARHAARAGGPGAGAARSRRPDPARPFHAGSAGRRRDRMVPPPPAGAHPPAHHRPPAPRDRTGHHGGLLRVPAPLAAPVRWRPASRRGWHAADHPPVAGLRIPGRGVGGRDSAAPRGQVSAGLSRSALPRWRSELGPHFAASGLRARARRHRRK